MIIENYWENNWLYVFDASFALHPYFFLNKNKTNKYNYNKKRMLFLNIKSKKFWIYEEKIFYEVRFEYSLSYMNM